MSFRLLAGAKRELHAAASRYERERDGLGDEFLDKSLRVLRRLERYPRSGPRTLGGYRRALLRRFPFALVYRAAGAGIIIVAIVHLKRKPGYWRRRVRNEDR